MRYKKLIDPELRPFAQNIPYNKPLIYCANLFQTASFHLTNVPQGIVHKSMTRKGYQGLPFRVEQFEPSGASQRLPCLLYIHGGAFSYKAAVHHKKLACLYALQAGCRVYFPDYHLTPRYPYPAACEDVLALYQYILQHAEALGIDRKRIGVAGDSAGACLAALLCSRCEREGLEPPCLQMLIYPVTDASMQTDSMKQFRDTPLWNAKNNRRMWSYYCKGLTPEEALRASPLHSPLPRFIPDAYIETAEYDCLHDEGILYGQRLREAGANVTINETNGTFHGYDSALYTQIALHNIRKRIAFLKKEFSGRAQDRCARPNPPDFVL